MSDTPPRIRIVDPTSPEAIPRTNWGTGRQPKYKIVDMRPGEVWAMPYEDQKLVRTTVSNVKWAYPQRRFDTWKNPDTNEILVRRLADISIEEYKRLKAEREAKGK
jgi:hypothetical protein